MKSKYELSKVLKIENDHLEKRAYAVLLLGKTYHNFSVAKLDYRKLKFIQQITLFRRIEFLN